jgi:hypothetical protein
MTHILVAILRDAKSYLLFLCTFIEDSFSKIFRDRGYTTYTNTNITNSKPFGLLQYLNILEEHWK